MLCSICKEKEAKLHYTDISGGKQREVHMCEDCAKSKGMDDPLGFSLVDELFGLGAAQEIEQAGGETGLKCATCGFTQADFKKAGRLGCPECYDTFAEPLAGLLKTMHKGTRHVGKTPEALRQSRGSSERLKVLQKKLAQAIEEENFEQAAALRDEIKQASARPAGHTTI